MPLSPGRKHSIIFAQWRFCVVGIHHSIARNHNPEFFGVEVFVSIVHGTGGSTIQPSRNFSDPAPAWSTRKCTFMSIHPSSHLRPGTTGTWSRLVTNRSSSEIMIHLHLFGGKRGVQLRNRDAQAQFLELHSSFRLQRRPVVPVTRACEPASLRACEPASLRACEPASLRACEPASLRACEPASLRACEPASLRACEPASLRAC